MSLRDILKGTGVALVTPFNSKLQIDFDALTRLIEYVIAGGVDYVVTLGTTGETPTLSKQEKIELINFTFSVVNGRVPVVIGIGGNNTQDCINDLHDFPVKNATAILSAAPYYNKPSQDGLFAHYKALAEASSKPIILYNVPGRTGRNMTAATTVRLANELPNIAGIKEASGDITQCMEIMRDKPLDFVVISGDDNLVLPQIACGMHGVISVAANCFPKEFSTIVKMCLQGDFKAARATHYPLLEAYDLLFIENNPAGVKAFLTQQGILENYLRLPLTPVSSGLYEKIKTYLVKMTAKEKSTT